MNENEIHIRLLSIKSNYFVCELSFLLILIFLCFLLFFQRQFNLYRLTAMIRGDKRFLIFLNGSSMKGLSYRKSTINRKHFYMECFTDEHNKKLCEQYNQMIVCALKSNFAGIKRQ